MLGQIYLAHTAGSQPSNDGVSGEHLSFLEAFWPAVALRHVSMLLRLSLGKTHICPRAALVSGRAR
jgi:hypothetical protein